MQTIRIANAQPGTATHIGIKRALRYISDGRAAIIGRELHFHVEHHAHQSTIAQNEKRLTNRGYDHDSHTRIAQLDQMAGVPIINPHELLAPRGRRNPRSPRMRAWPISQ